MPQYEHDGLSIYYEEHGGGFPLLLIAPGGLNSTVDFWSRMPINLIELFPDEFHVIAMDQRNAGRSSGPLPLVDPWGAYASDQLVLPGNDMAHPFGVGMEVGRLLPHAEVVEHWKEAENVPQAIDSMRRFLRAHTPLEAVAS